MKTFLVLLGMIFPIFILFNLPDFVDCKSTGSNTNRETTYSLISGCYIQSEVGFVPLNKWNPLDIRK